MHIQVRTSVKVAAFTDEVDDEFGSVDYPRGSLSELLSILAEDRPGDPGFSLASAGGHDIELGGEFSFWVEPRDATEDHATATEVAMERIRAAGYDATPYHVQARHLEDTKGALRDFVAHVADNGLHVVEISIGAPDREGIPVQIFTAKLS